MLALEDYVKVLLRNLVRDDGPNTSSKNHFSTASLCGTAKA